MTLYRYVGSMVPPSVPIWLDDLLCTSSDTSLLTCSHGGIGVENCGHSEDVFVSCTSSGCSKSNEF